MRKASAIVCMLVLAGLLFANSSFAMGLGMYIDLGGLVVTNTFAFGGNPSKKIRLWGGPQILVGLYGGETDKEYLSDCYAVRHNSR